MKQYRCSAVVLAAGQGKRMNSSVQKQFLLLKEKPLLYYALKVFQESFVDEIILVTGKSEIEYCKNEIVNKFGFTKVSCVVEGGKERYHSVQNGMEAIKACDYIFIHDGARPFVNQAILERAFKAVLEHGACVVGMPVKDTIKIADSSRFAKETPNRSSVWMIQTPQVFKFEIIKAAYNQLLEKEQEFIRQGIQITDDAMVAEAFFNTRVKLVEGDYSNIKITTPEDLKIAEVFLL